MIILRSEGPRDRCTTAPHSTSPKQANCCYCHPSSWTLDVTSRYIFNRKHPQIKYSFPIQHYNHHSLPIQTPFLPSPSNSTTKKMSSKKPRRFAQIIRLRPEHADEYVRLHAAVWPTILDKIQECGIRDYSIFYDDGGRLQGDTEPGKGTGRGEATGLLFASFKYVVSSTPYYRFYWSRLC